MSTPPHCISLWGEWHSDGRPVLQAEDKGGEPEIDSVCQFLWHKHSHPSRFQAPTKTSLNMELGINMQNWLWQASIIGLNMSLQL